MTRRHSTKQRSIASSRALLGAACLALFVAGCGDARQGEAIGSTSAASTFTNDQPAFDYFVGKGLTTFQAAGIVGNLDQESGVDPTSVQSGGPGRGIAQWSVGGRWDTDSNDNATWYAGTKGASVLSLQLQLDFIWYELTTFSGYGLTALRQTTNITDATVAFETDFEGCGTCDQSQRIAYAETVLAAFASDIVDAGTAPDTGATSVDAGTPCTVTATGESGECIDTAACAALGGHVSTPGYCPGPDNIQCCTATAVDAGGPDSSVPPPTDGGLPPAHDSGMVGPQVDSGRNEVDAGRSAVDAGRPAPVLDAGTGSTGVGTQSPDGGIDVIQSGGCATTPASTGAGSGLWLVVVGGVAVRRRKRR